tara:strand:+ start:7127 stop:7339 length:213 start_codon:yes stop_codon:yes gene_type:complete
MENLVKEILQEPEFKQGGFVYKHVAGDNPEPIRAVQSTVDRMRDLYDIEDSQFGQLCERLLNEITKICKS